MGARDNKISGVCCDVQPFQVPCDVKPWCGPLRIDDSTLPIADDTADFVNESAGADCELWLLNTQRSTVDGLFSEPITRAFNGPYKLKGTITYADSQPSAEQEGHKSFWPSSVWFSRKAIEDLGIRPPGDGDVVVIMNLPFHNESAVDGWDTTGAQFAFSLQDCDYDGQLGQTPSFTGFRCDMNRDNTFAPERRIERRLP